MKTKIVIAVISMLFAFSVFATPVKEADGIKPYYAMLGDWHGKAELVEGGKVAAKLKAKFDCHKGSGGMAVICTFSGKGAKGMKMTENDLFGFDPVGQEGHWYAVTNTGDVHDHITHWADAKTMIGNYSWQQDGKKMHEHIIFKFASAKKVRFVSDVMQDDQQVAKFSGEFKR